MTLSAAKASAATSQEIAAWLVFLFGSKAGMAWLAPAWLTAQGHHVLHAPYSCSAFRILFRHPQDPWLSTLCNHISLGFSRGSPLRRRPHTDTHVQLRDHSLRSLYDNSLASSNKKQYKGVQYAVRLQRGRAERKIHHPRLCLGRATESVTVSGLSGLSGGRLQKRTVSRCCLCSPKAVYDVSQSRNFSLGK